MDKKTKLWFKRRRYGFGWTPITWQGWLTVFVFLLVVIGSAQYLMPDKTIRPSELQLVTYLLIVLSSILLLLGISYAKGPMPRWRWGSKPGDNPDEDI